MACTHRSESRSSLVTIAWLAALASACGGDDGSATGASEAGSSEGGTTGTSASSTTAGEATTASSTTMGTSVEGGSSSATDDTSPDTSGSESGGQMGIACLDEQFVAGVSPGGDYSMFDVPIGSHCQGTNQQDIADVERIVFLGDSVTVGTPPTGAPEFYRSILAEALATQFGLAPPEAGWEQVNVGNGTAQVKESGAFASCAVWGAQNGDLAGQLDDCFAEGNFDARTLVVFTMGGNDGASIAKDYLDGAPLADVLAELDAMVAAHEAAVEWLVEPDKFPNGVFVVNANVYEFTDETFEFLSCPTAAIAGFNSNPEMPDVLLSSLRHINEEYMRIAQENGTDVVFMQEGFCGHGFRANDPASPCYRGPDNATWFDLTCIHPTPAGHAALAEMFLNVISE